jgi:hypothetical protein
MQHVIQRRFAIFLTAFVAAIAAWFAAAGTASAAVYWADYMNTSGNWGWIGRAEDDGSGANPRWRNVGAPTGVADLDVDGGYVYFSWARTIGRIRTDGTGLQRDIFGTATPMDLAFTTFAISGDHVYYLMTPQDAGVPTGLYRRRLAAGSREDFVGLIPAGTCSQPIDIALSPTHVYWSSARCGLIGRMRLDATGVEPSVVSLPGGSEVGDVAVRGSALWWVEDYVTRGVSTSSLTGGSQRRLVGTSAAFPTTFAVGASSVFWGTNTGISLVPVIGGTVAPDIIAVPGNVEALAADDPDACPNIAGYQAVVPANQTLVAGTCRSTAGNNVFTGNSGPDRIVGGAGNDRIFGRGGDDVLSGGIGNDTLDGGPGLDELLGGAGADVISARDGRAGDTVSCGAGVDTVRADRGDRIARDCERRTIG